MQDSRARRRALAVASDPLVARAANDLLARGNAVDAVAAGVLAAAGAHAGVLLGPVQVLVGGAGVGLRAIDGRVRQPGHGAQRPRGLLPDEAVPPAARVAVPALPAALAAALASFGKSTAAAVFAPGIELARAVPERAQVLQRLARRGPSALAEAALADELVAAAGRVAGGLVTAEDLARARPTTDACAVVTMGDRRAATVPWGADAVRDASTPARAAACVRIVSAADVHGAFAIACYEVPEESLAIPALGLAAPLLAEPVLRGTARVRPGDARPAAAPMALSDHGGVDLAVGVSQATDAEALLRELLRAIESGTPIEVAAAALVNAQTCGVMRARRGTIVAIGSKEAE